MIFFRKRHVGMELEYKLQEEDYIAFNLYHAKKSPSISNSLKLQRLMGPIVFIPAAFLTAYYTSPPLVFWLVLFGIASFMWLRFYPQYLDREMTKRLKKILNEGKTEGLYQKRNIEVTEDGISQSSESGYSKIKWRDLESIDNMKEYIYVFDTSLSAFIIPKRVFKTPDEEKLFIDQTNTYFNAQSASKTVNRNGY